MYIIHVNKQCIVYNVYDTFSRVENTPTNIGTIHVYTKCDFAL